MINVRRGLNLPISGAPEQVIHDGPAIRQVAVVGADYHGMKPTMAVREGDRVKLGQLLFTDKKTPGVRFTAPAAGVVTAVNRGERRAFQSVVIDIDGNEAEDFASYSAQQLSELDRQAIVDNLVNSGQWVGLRTRPYSKVPSPEATPASIFITAMDTSPLAADPKVVIAERNEDFVNGLRILTRLTDGAVNLCVDPEWNLAGGEVDGVVLHQFAGPHPAGLAGTHIHFVDPVSADKSVWTVGYQEVIAFGALFTTGVIDTARVVSLAGPQVTSPRLVRSVLGANINQMVIGELANDDNRIISGSVLAGRTAAGNFAFLGRYHQQISVIREDRDRQFLHYLRPGGDKHSVLPAFVSALSNKLFAMTSSTNGSERAMVPTGAYERVMPLDILPVQLLRSLIVGDTAVAQSLGCLELDEEDLGLCTYACVGKYEYGPILRDNLTKIELEG
ncbi:Na(+)-translocating NADH-quinone reductase subunit A [Porticoccaceae bacterium]|nr:Na(+)-translocating NADH-quinone reductase subunit A [Porticoccaceae bacterium]